MRKSHEIILKTLIILFLLGGAALLIYVILPFSSVLFGDDIYALIIRSAVCVYTACCMLVVSIGFVIVTRCASGKAFSMKTADMVMYASAVAVISSIIFLTVNLVFLFLSGIRPDLVTMCRMAFSIIGVIVLAFGILLSVVANYVKDATEIKEELEGVI